jgi:hypothetical protein
MNKISTIDWWRDYKHVHLAEHVSKYTSEKRSKNPLSWVVRYSQAPGDMSQPESNRCPKEGTPRDSQRSYQVLSGLQSGGTTGVGMEGCQVLPAVDLFK